MGMLDSMPAPAHLGQAIEYRNNGIGLQANRHCCVQGVWRHNVFMDSLRPADWLCYCDEEVVSLFVDW